MGWTGVLDVSKLRCWQYCIGKVFVTIWSDISMQRMENCLNTEREGGQSTGIHSVPGKTGILLLALQRNTRALQFDSRPQKQNIKTFFYIGPIAKYNTQKQTDIPKQQ